MSIESLVREIREAVRHLDVQDTLNVRTSSSSRDFPITVEGHEWKGLPMGQISHDPELVADYLQNQGWQFQDADRSGIYLVKDETIARFC